MEESIDVYLHTLLPVTVIGINDVEEIYHLFPSH